MTKRRPNKYTMYTQAKSPIIEWVNGVFNNKYSFIVNNTKTNNRALKAFKYIYKDITTARKRYVKVDIY